VIAWYSLQAMACAVPEQLSRIAAETAAAVGVALAAQWASANNPMIPLSAFFQCGDCDRMPLWFVVVNLWFVNRHGALLVFWQKENANFD